jgi:hypothetical protein
MSAEKTAPGLVESNLVEFDRTGRRPALIGVDLLHQATVRRPDFRLTGAGRKADLFFRMSDGKPVPTFPDIAPDLVGLLMSHGARIRRAARPRCDIRLAVYTTGGGVPVRIDQPRHQRSPAPGNPPSTFGLDGSCRVLRDHIAPDQHIRRSGKSSRTFAVEDADVLENHVFGTCGRTSPEHERRRKPCSG